MPIERISMSMILLQKPATTISHSYWLIKRRTISLTGISDRWRLDTAFADCRKATYTAKEGGTTSAALVQKHLPWKDAAIVRRSQGMLALRPDA